ARGAGSTAVICVPSPPSRTARAIKRVECPEPTSTMRAGRDMRTMAYAAAASRRGNQSWSQRGAGGTSAPMAMSSGARSSIQPRTRIGDKSGLEEQSLARHERAGHVLGIGDVAQRAAVVLDAIAGGAVGMIERRGTHAYAFHRGERIAGVEVAVFDGGAEHFRRYRKERRHHELPEHALERHRAA